MNPTNIPSDTRLWCSDVLIGGQWRQTARHYTVHNPATGVAIAEATRAAAPEADQAIEAADEAFGKWRETTPAQRRQLLDRWAKAMRAEASVLAEIVTREQGKPREEALAEVEYAASFLDWFAGEADRIYGDIIPGDNERRMFAIKQPIGVVAAITPWNFPLAMITRKVGAALAAGCSVIVKPSEYTPLSANALALLATESGIPPGVLNVIAGDAAEIGEALMSSPIVRKVSFTGSTRVGKQLMTQAAATVKKLSLELGGNAPFIVFDDADIERAVEGAIAAKFRNSGQTCICVNRFLIQDAIHERFTARLVERVRELSAGAQSKTTIGPLINASALDKVSAHVADATTRGARVLCGGAALSGAGYFFEPTVIDRASQDMLLAREETFGPVAACYRFHSEAEALNLANSTESGLAAYVYGGDIARLWRVAERLEVGMVGLNDTALSNAAAPFGGVKESGLGREGSKYGIAEYLETKYMLLGGLATST